MPNPTVTDILTGLTKMTFVEKRDDFYEIDDPLLRAGLKENPLPE